MKNYKKRLFPLKQIGLYITLVILIYKTNKFNFNNKNKIQQNIIVFVKIRHFQPKSSQFDNLKLILCEKSVFL